MKIIALSRKLKIKLREQGLTGAYAKVSQYLNFLLMKNWYKIRGSYAEIEQGDLKIILHTGRIKIYWQGLELTANPGFVTSLFLLDERYDCGGSDWSIQKVSSGKLLLKNIWKKLPVNQIWEISFLPPNEAVLKLLMELEEDLTLLGKEINLALSPEYTKSTVPFKNGALIPAAGSLPDILFAFNKENPVSVSEHGLGRAKGVNIINMRIKDNPLKTEYPAGRYEFFSAAISIYGKNEEDQSRLAAKLGRKFPGDTKALNKEEKEKIEIVMVNLPWQRDGKPGVRAGSRWPHIKDKAEGEYFPFPFYLAYTAALLKKNGFRVKLIDAIAQQLSERDFLNMIKELSPGLLLAETSTVSLNDDMALLRKIDKKNMRFILCGPDINIRTGSFLKENDFIDFVLAGEYEFTMLDLAVSLRDNKELSIVAGLIYRDQTGKINFNGQRALLDNLDKLPWPLRQQLPMHKYLDAPCELTYPTAQMWASRGCPFRCIFCLWPQIMYGNNKYRVRNVADVVDEMEFLARDMGFKSIYFDDDTFNTGKPRMLEFCAEIKKRKLRIPWAIMARADLMDEEILVKMKEAGLFAVKYGVESANQSLLDNCNKNMDLEKATRMIKLTKKLGIKTHLTFTFGLPGETKKTIQNTVDYLFAIDPDSAQFSITTYYPGTQYFEYLDKNKLIKSKDWGDYDGNFKSVVDLEGLSAEYLENTRKEIVDRWLMHLRLKRGFRENYQVFKRYIAREGLSFTLAKTVNYLKIRLVANNPAKKLYSKGKECLKKALKYCRSGRVAGDYLDMLGVFDGSYAYKGPNFVQIDLTNNCNNDCIGCWCNSPLLLDKKQDETAKKKTIPYWKAKQLIDELKSLGTREIYLAGGGEPFMHPMFLDIVEYIKKHNFICDINTNFTLADEGKIKKLIQLRVDYLVVSVWAATPQTYVATHPNKSEDAFYKIKERLKLLNSSKDKLPRVHIYNVITNLNFHEIESMVDFALEVKADSTGFTVLDTIPGRTDSLLLDDGQRKQVLKQCERIKSRQDLGALKILEFEKFIKRISASCAATAEYDKDEIENIPCYIGWLFSRIMADGNVNACLKAHRIPVGTIYKNSFRDIWNAGAQQEFRRKTLSCKKNDPFFKMIGNDPQAKVGCSKSCDDFSRNIYIHRRIFLLTAFERANLKLAADFKRISRKLKPKRYVNRKNKFRLLNVVADDSFDIALIMPPPWAAKMPPLGIAYLATYLRHNGYKPFVYDLNLFLCNKAKGKKKLFWRVENLNNKSPEDVAKDIVAAFKKEFSLLVDELCRLQTKVIGFSTSLINLWVALEITKMLKAKDPSKIVIFGGPGCYWDFKRVPPGLVDAFVIGEGEEVLCTILKRLKEGIGIEDIPGIITSQDGSYSKFTPGNLLPIDNIPFPKFSEFELKEYNKGDIYKPLPVLSSRGCIGRCNYCIDCRMWGTLRHRAAENVFQEITFHLKNHGIREFEFNDLICNGNLKQLEIFCDLIIKSGYDINWVSYAIVRNDMDASLFSKMRKGGCHTLIYGVESGSNTVLKRMNKYYTAQEAERIIRLTHEAGICTNINIIVGYPGETEDELEETMEFLRRNKEYIDEVTNVSGCVLFFDSAMGKEKDKFGISLPENTDPLLYQDNTGLTPEVRKARVRSTLSFISDLGIKCRIVNNPTERRIKVSRLNNECAGNLGKDNGQ